MNPIQAVGTSLYADIGWKTSKSNPDVVKVYQGTHPSTRGKVIVKPATLEVLQEVQKAHLEAEATQFKFGRANIGSDVYQYGGESVARYFMQIKRPKNERLNLPSKESKRVGTIEPGSESHEKMLAHAKSIAGLQGAACQEVSILMAATLAGKLGHKHPVGILEHTANEARLKHVSTVVGDPRTPEYGERNTVVVDHWAVFPVAHTMDQGKFAGEESFILADWQPSSVPFGFSADNATNCKSNTDINIWLRRRQFPLTGQQLVLRLFEDEVENRKNTKIPGIFEQIFIAKDPATRYASDEGDPGQSFNLVHGEYFYNKKTAVEGLERLMNERPDLFTNNQFPPMR